MLMPSPKFPYFIMIKAQFGLCFFKALLDGPPQPAEPNKAVESSACRSVADKIRVFQLIVDKSPPDYEPNLLARKALFIQGDAPFGKFIAERSLSASATHLSIYGRVNSGGSACKQGHPLFLFDPGPGRCRASKSFFLHRHGYPPCMRIGKNTLRSNHGNDLRIRAGYSG